MRRIIAVIAVVVMLGVYGTTAEAGSRLRIVNYNVATLRSENPDNRNCVPGSLSVVFEALNDDDKPGFAVAPHCRSPLGTLPPSCITAAAIGRSRVAIANRAADASSVGPAPRSWFT